MGEEVAVALPAEVELDTGQCRERCDLVGVLRLAYNAHAERRVYQELQCVGQKLNPLIALQPSRHEKTQRAVRRRLWQARLRQIEIGEGEGHMRDDGADLLVERHACSKLARNEFGERDHALAHAGKLALKPHHEMEAVAGMDLGVVHHDHDRHAHSAQSAHEENVPIAHHGDDGGVWWIRA